MASIAGLGNDNPSLVYVLGRHHLAGAPLVTRLPTRLPPRRSLLPRLLPRAVRRRWLGGVPRVLPQLRLQLRHARAQFLDQRLLLRDQLAQSGNLDVAGVGRGHGPMKIMLADAKSILASPPSDPALIAPMRYADPPERLPEEFIEALVRYFARQRFGIE